MKKTILNSKNLNYFQKFRGSKKVILCHGVFDILHYGHIDHFKQAKTFGDILVVSITEDSFVDKGPDRPIFSSLIRAKTILSLQIVDFVIISNSSNAINILNKIRPNIYVKDQEYQKNKNFFLNKFSLEKKYLKRINCKLKFTNKIKYSSSNIANYKFNNFNDQQILFLNSIREKYSKQYIESIFSKLRKLTVCVLGDPIIDTYNFSSVKGTASKFPTLASVHHIKEHYAGGSFAVASMLSSLGISVNLIYYSDKEKITQFIENKLNKKINLIKIRKKNFSIPIIERIVNLPRYEKLHQMYYYKNFLHDKKSLNKFKKEIKNFYKKSDLMLVIDFGFNFLNLEITKFLKNFIFSINVHSNSITKNFVSNLKHKLAEYSTLNLREYLFDRRLNSEMNVNKIIEYIKKSEQKNNFSVTLGANGSVIKKKNNVIYCPSFFNTVKDTTGSGDAYFAITSCLNKLDVEPDLIAFLGNIYAGLHANIIGNKSFVDKDELFKNVEILLS
jgi:cytidyltransferase-like protein